ncbi:hypothetical protein ACFWN5_37805 [Streptomyces sp. NPDC058430]|uniref:hypothetical protein n=1 Tax=Streptomyces sp. NPDC058430 TaxID=3346495 RepID=UPI003656D60A
MRQASTDPPRPAVRRGIGAVVLLAVMALLHGTSSTRPTTNNSPIRWRARGRPAPWPTGLA